MKLLDAALQIIVALSLLNVWLVRSKQSTAYRGGNAQSMHEEFASYGLPPWAMYLTGALKVSIAVCFFAGLWLHFLVRPAALVLCILMLGAIVMHLRLRDPLKKFVPALSILVMSTVLSLT